mmetsp:Transcript_19469/g.23363  ORF Transcript_19469/g.23363 Transcript_19469/m.23363 type:complete len:173 (+) Transcript_19469:86-604(+)
MHYFYQIYATRLPPISTIATDITRKSNFPNTTGGNAVLLVLLMSKVGEVGDAIFVGGVSLEEGSIVGAGVVGVIGAAVTGSSVSAIVPGVVGNTEAVSLGLRVGEFEGTVQHSSETALLVSSQVLPPKYSSAMDAVDSNCQQLDRSSVPRIDDSVAPASGSSILSPQSRQTS